MLEVSQWIVVNTPFDRLYYYGKNNPGVFSSAIKLYTEAKKRNKKIKLIDVKNFLAKQRLYTRFHKTKRKFKRSIIMINKPYKTLMSDLAVLKNIAKYNKGFSYLAVFSDAFSRRIMGLIPQKTKTSKETSKSLEKILKAFPSYQLFWTDKGLEYEGDCKDVYKKYDVKHYTTNAGNQKVAIIERQIRFIKELLYKRMSFAESYTYLNYLEDVMKEINNSKHRILEMTPLEAEKPKNRSLVYYRTVDKPTDKRKEEDFKYELGTIVRLMLDISTIFGQKAHTGTFSEVNKE